jgi:hypothetical protein
MAESGSERRAIDEVGMGARRGEMVLLVAAHSQLPESST